jgi:hypothetical protein
MLLAFSREENSLGVDVLLMPKNCFLCSQKESALADLFYKLKIRLG